MIMVNPACTRETGVPWNDTDHVSTRSERESNRREETFKSSPMKDRVWTTIRGFPQSEKHSIETRISKEVTRMVRHRDQNEREEDGGAHWDTILPTLKRKFQNQLEDEGKSMNWVEHLYRGSHKTRFEICENADDELGYIRAIQGHSGGMVIQPELMNYVLIPCKWKQFIYHMGRARDRYSIAEAGLVAGGKENEEGRQTIFFAPLDPYHSDAIEVESSTDFSKPRKVHYQTHWKPEQDAVYWINLSRAQDCGLKFWQTQSHAIIVFQSVPSECVEKVVTEQGSRQLFSRKLTPRKGPKVTLRDTWVQLESNMLRMPRETDVCSQMLNPSTISLESDTCSSHNSELKSIASIDHAHGKLVLHEIDLRVNGIPNDEIYEDKQYMQSVTKQIEKIVDVEKSLQDEPLENNISSVEAAMNIYEPGNYELHEVQQRTVKVCAWSCGINCTTCLPVAFQANALHVHQPCVIGIIDVCGEFTTVYLLLVTVVWYIPCREDSLRVCCFTEACS